MSIDLLKGQGTPLEKQVFTWRDMVREPISKLNDDAFTRVRVILMNGIEQDQNRFLHALARVYGGIRQPLAEVRRIDHHQQTLVNWLLAADHSPLETTIGYEQVAIEVTAAVAQREPDPYMAQTYRFGLLEDFDHMYRFAALMDRVEGKDANNILQSYTDILPGRPTMLEHRAPHDDLRRPFDKDNAEVLTKLHALTIAAAENQTRDYYMTIGPMFADPLARQVYAEIASIEEQHVTQYESISDPSESMIGQWLLREANEVYMYYSCVESESSPRIKAIWERFLDYELGQLSFVTEIFKDIDRRDPAELLPETLPAPVPFDSNRRFVRKVLADEVDMRAAGTEYVTLSQETRDSLSYREQLNHDGVPTEIVAAGYIWTPGTELGRDVMRVLGEKISASPRPSLSKGA